VAATEPAVYSKGSRKEYDRTETDGSWEAMEYDGVDDVDREGCSESIQEPVVHGLDADVDPIGEETTACHEITTDDVRREKETAWVV
jgi:hypothetical protein